MPFPRPRGPSHEISRVGAVLLLYTANAEKRNYLRGNAYAGPEILREGGVGRCTTTPEKKSEQKNKKEFRMNRTHVTTVKARVSGGTTG